MDEATRTEPAHSPLVASYAVLSGLALLLPVPFIDDAVRTRVQRHMVRALGDRRGIVLSDDTVNALADDPPGPPLYKRALVAVAMAPVKRVFKKTFVLLGGKEVVDTVSSTYHLGYLVDLALAERWHEQHDAAAIRAAMQSACAEVGTKPIEKAVRATYQGSRSALARLFRRRRGAEAAEPSAPLGPESPEVVGLAERLRAGVLAVPQEHFAQIRDATSRALSAPVPAT